ncbi:hypothetical protein niasHT_029899 [Heterodera trifolii]|uniref:Uncharacterized protein n=1 Tax=Heterodera trifolii TaxID=157864 RepID=A0ABD2KB67_9BILA
MKFLQLFINAKINGQFETENQHCSCPSANWRAVTVQKVVSEYCNPLVKLVVFIICVIMITTPIFYLDNFLVSLFFGPTLKMPFVRLLASMVAAFLAICVLRMEHTHAAVQILFFCSGCDRNTYKTYEIGGPIIGHTVSSYGRYRKCLFHQIEGIVIHDYNSIEDIFNRLSWGQMVMDYMLDSDGWSNLFINRLCRLR